MSRMSQPFSILASIFAVMLLAMVQLARAANDFSFETSRELPMIYLNIISDGGAANDPAGKEGLATVFGQMLMRGTKTKTKLEFMKAIESLGASVDADVRPEGTVIRVALLAENRAKVLGLVTEMLTEPRIDGAELTKLKHELIGVVLSEKGNDARLAQRHFQKYLYGAHPYSNPINGTEKGLGAITLDDVKGVYARTFSGANLRLFGSGDGDSDAIQSWWNGLQNTLDRVNPDAKAVPGIAAPTFAEGRRLLIIDKPGATQSQVLFGHSSPRPDAAGYHALRLGNHAFGAGSFEARLMQEVRVKRGWTYVAVNRLVQGRQPRHYMVYYAPKTADTAPALKLGIEMVEDLAAKGITPQEFHFAQESLVNRAPFDNDTARKRLENETNEYLFNLEHGFFNNLASNMKRVSEGEVGTALGRYFKPQNLVITVLGDASKLKAELSKVHGLLETKVIDYKAE